MYWYEGRFINSKQKKKSAVRFKQIKQSLIEWLAEHINIETKTYIQTNRIVDLSILHQQNEYFMNHRNFWVVKMSLKVPQNYNSLSFQGNHTFK